MLLTKDGAVITPPLLQAMTMAELVEYQVRIRQGLDEWSALMERTKFGPVNYRASHNRTVFELELLRIANEISDRSPNVISLWRK